MEVDPTSAFAAVGRLGEVDCDAMHLRDWLLYDYKTGKMSWVAGSVAMIEMLLDGSEERVSGNKTIHLICRDEIAFSSVSFEFAKAAWLWITARKMDYSVITLLDARDAYLRRRSIFISFVSKHL